MGQIQPRPPGSSPGICDRHHGKILERELGFKIGKLKSGSLGGDQQIGAKIVENKIDFLIFFWYPTTNITFLAKWTQAKKLARHDIFALSA